jgi:hypothetical protein
MSSKQIIKTILLFKKLSLLGLFRTKNLEISGENGFCNIYFSYFENKRSSISIIGLRNCIIKLYPLINLILVKESLFLFINVDGNRSSFLTKIFYSLLKKINAYCIYDWGFGLLTNFSKKYYEFFLEKQAQLHKLPDIVFLLRVLEKQHCIMTEIQNAGALSLGLVDYENSSSVDYPIPSNTSTEYSYFFFKLLTKVITNSKVITGQCFSKGSKKKIKRLKFYSRILLRNRSKKKFNGAKS